MRLLISIITTILSLNSYSQSDTTSFRYFKNLNFEDTAILVRHPFDTTNIFSKPSTHYKLLIDSLTKVNSKRFYEIIDSLSLGIENKLEKFDTSQFKQLMTFCKCTDHNDKTVNYSVSFDKQKVGKLNYTPFPSQNEIISIKNEDFEFIIIFRQKSIPVSQSIPIELIQYYFYKKSS